MRVRVHVPVFFGPIIYRSSDDLSSDNLSSNNLSSDNLSTDNLSSDNLSSDKVVQQFWHPLPAHLLLARPPGQFSKFCLIW